LFVGATAVAPIVILNTVASATIAPTQIVYVQKSGQQTTGPFIEYKGGGGNTSTQLLPTTTSACSSTVSTVLNPSSVPPLLPLSASYYSSGYSGSPTSASVGSALVGFGSKAVAETGVCYKSTTYTSPGYTVQPSEGLVFSMGESNILTQGQLFSEASIPLKNQNRSPVYVDLVLRRANSYVETIGPITVPAQGTESENDTNDCPVVSTGDVSSNDEFDQVELQVASPSTGSVSVIGPNCDSDNDADDQGLPTFTVANAAPIFTSALSDTVPAGSSGTFSFPVSATGTPTPTFSLSGAPSGVSLANTTTPTGTATLTGTNVAPGVYTFTIDASNVIGTTTQTTAQIFSLKVLTTIAQTSPTSGSTTTVLSDGLPIPITTYDTLGAVTFAGTMPSGFSLDTSTGVVTVTSTLAVGSYTISGTDSDAYGDVGTWTYKLTVNAVTITQTSATSGSTTTATSSSFSTKLVTTGQIGAETFTPTSSPVSSTPPGFTVSQGGSISTNGTTLAAGVYTASGTASDAYGDTGSWSYTLTVDEPPAITSLPNLIVPAPASGGTGTLFTFTVVTTGYPAPTITDTGFPASGDNPACVPSSLPEDLANLFSTTAGSGTATLSATPQPDDGGVYTLCFDASNGVGPDATQAFTLYVTSPSTPLEACGSKNGSCTDSPVTASLTVDSGSKSFQDLTTSSSDGTEQVAFDAEGPLSETYTATLDVGWDDLTECVPYSGSGVSEPVCQPAYVTIPPDEGGSGTPQPVLPCDSDSLPTPPAIGWCSMGETYSYVDVGGGKLETNIAEVVYGSGDMTVSHE
jgi:hypothetical protein